MLNENFIFTFALTVFAGLSTGIGSALAFFAKRTNTKLLTISLGFSAGVMIYVSFVDFFAKSRVILTTELGSQMGSYYSVSAFFFGILVIGLIDRLVPSVENPHKIRTLETIQEIEKGEFKYKQNKLMKMGIMSALAIAIHNIPKGIAVSIPLFHATGSRKKAFTLSFLSGLTEPLGALIGYLLLMPFLNNVVFGLLFAFVAGIMVFISLDELLYSRKIWGTSSCNLRINCRNSINGGKFIIVYIA